MNNPAVYMLSVVLAGLLHAAVVVLLMMNWELNGVYAVTEIEPFYLEASIVSQNPYRKKKIKEKQAQKKKSKDRAVVAGGGQHNLQQPAQQTKTDPDEPSTMEGSRVAAQENAATRRLEAERLRMEQNLAQSIIAEQNYRRAITDDEQALAYVAQIQRDIVQYWSRPPSARNGMQALLRVFLVPTGEVVDVALETPSGNDAFDRSAIAAVRKAQRFTVPTEPRQFERNFREFEVLFRPEDLRY